MAILKSECPRRLRNPLHVPPVHQRIDIARQPRRIRSRPLHLEIHRQPADHLIRDPRRLHRRRKAPEYFL
ncbi:MAG: hypothetical protein JNK48_25875 [Bryobacterales bacterium]|nr:hypothetical protein [Bryobacterales bacterium]